MASIKRACLTRSLMYKDRINNPCWLKIAI